MAATLIYNCKRCKHGKRVEYPFLEFRRQARSAGYGVGKAKRSTISDDELAAALM